MNIDHIRGVKALSRKLVVTPGRQAGARLTRPSRSSKGENSGKVWDAYDSQTLAAAFMSGVNPEDLAELFQRSAGGVFTQLANLGVIAADGSPSYRDYYVQSERRFNELGVYFEDNVCVANITPSLAVFKNPLLSRIKVYATTGHSAADSCKLDAYTVGLYTGNGDTLSETPAEKADQEKAMNIEITTKSYIGGVDASTLTDDQLFEMIAKKEAEVSKLKTIKVESKKLTAQIEKAEQQIKDLATFIDNRK